MGIFRKNKKEVKSPRQSNVGKPNQKVFSYYTASKNQLNNFDRQSQAVRSETKAKIRVSKLLQNWFVVISCFIFLVIAVYMLSLSRKASIDINGPLYRPALSYQNTIDDILKKDLRSYAKPLLNSSQIEKDIKNAIPEARTVSVNAGILGHRPEIIITTDEPLAVFNNLNEKFILSERGRLLLPVNDANIETNKLPIIDNLTGVEGKAGEQFLSPDEALAFNNLLLQQDPSTLGLQRYELPVNPRELYSSATANRGFKVKYLLSDDIALQHGAYLATLKKLQSMNVTPASYVDVRLVEKVYFL
jgi:hypothetical protein